MTSQQTFFEKLRAHEGGLVKLDISGGPWKSRHPLSGKTGMVCSVDVVGRTGTAAKVSLFIDGKVRTVYLYEDEVQFLEGPG